MQTGILAKYLRDPSLDIQWIYRFPQGNWNVDVFNTHHNLNYHWFEMFPAKKWNFRILATEESPFRMEWILKLPYYNWDLYYLSRSRDLTLEIFRIYKPQYWNTRDMSLYAQISEEWLREYPNILWDFRNLSRNRNFQFSWLSLFPKAEWDFYYISNLYHNNNILEMKNWSYLNTLTLPIFKQFPRCYTWNPEFIILNKKFNIEWLISNIYLNWSQNSNIDLMKKRKSLKGTPLHQNHPQFHHMIRLIQTAFRTSNFTHVKYLFQMAKQKVVPTSEDDYFTCNMSKPLVLQDLSGDIYEVEGWWNAKM